VTKFFAPIRGLKYGTPFMTNYAAGMRVSEVSALRVAVIDSKRMVIRVD